MKKNYRNGKQFSGCQELRDTRERGGCNWEKGDLQGSGSGRGRRQLVLEPLQSQ